MALLYIEGFDDGLYTYRAVANGAVSSSYGKDGNGMRVGDNSGTTYRVGSSGYTSSTRTTCGVSLRAIYPSSSYNYLYGINGSPGNSPASYWNVMVQWDTVNNRLYVTDRTGSTYGASNTFYANTWYYLEFQVVHANAPTGEWELRMDGAAYLSATSRDTFAYGSVPGVYEFGSGHYQQVDEMHIDNLYLLDDTGTTNNDFIGPITVETLFPSGNGTTSGMTGSDGNQTDNYLLVDENPADTADYVESATEGDYDTYTMDNVAGAPTVYGVQGTVYASKDDDDAKFMRTVTRSGTTEDTGTSVSLSNGTWSIVENVDEIDPDTATQWLYGGVNAMEFGQEVRDS